MHASVVLLPGATTPEAPHSDRGMMVKAVAAEAN